MNQECVIDRIRQLCAERGWSYYRLALASGIPHSTLHNMLNRSTMPSLLSLEKMCKALEISMAQFFEPEGELRLSAQEKELVIIYRSLSRAGREKARSYLQGLADQKMRK